MLEIDNFTLTVAGQRLLRIDRLQVAAGQLVTLLGPSGTGKSSFLKAIAGVSDPEACVVGCLRLQGRDLTALPAHRRRIGYVEQRPALFPHLNVQQNLAFGQRQRDQAALDKALAVAELSDLAQADVATLSGGQAARVALMRTLLAAPRALLLDEPFAALDPALRASLRSFVFAQARAAGLPTVLVTHDRADAAAAGGPLYSLTRQSLKLHDAAD